MKCKICGASCRCKNAKGGICCSCHSHKGRRLTAAVRAMPRESLPPEWLPEVDRLLAREREDQAAATQLQLFD